jgi:c-di-GMP-binding flagellar brake protein YcgR
MVDEMFIVGMQVSLETANREHLFTHVMGWEEGLFLIVRVVYAGGKPAEIMSHDRCRIRFIRDGIAYGFETEVISVQFHPFPVMFLEYPETIEQVRIRRKQRIRTDIQAKVCDLSGRLIARAAITDLCEDGCGMNMPVSEGRDLTRERAYRISFNILETDLDLECFFRGIRIDSGIRHLGAEFINVPRNEKETITVFLDIIMKVFTSKVDSALSKIMASEEKLCGHLDELSIPDILQVFEQNAKSGILHISTHHKTGMISFGGGLIMDATYDHLSGEDALVELLSLREGGFHYFSREISSGSIRKPVSFVIMEICRLIDERNALAGFMPGSENRLILCGKADISDPDMKLVASIMLGGSLTLDEIHKSTGLSYTRSSLAVSRLVKSGILKILSGPETIDKIMK